MGDESETSAREGPRGDDPTQLQATRLGGSLGAIRSAPAIGTLIGKYVTERTIGSGGMGVVIAARHQQLGELVAIKLLHPKAAKDEVQVERFVREARATARIKSEHVVRVLDAGEDEETGAPYIVMEHLEGDDLAKILKMHGPMPVTMAVDMMIQVCEAVSAAHALGIIHRDLKPSNFFVSARADGSPLVKVLDFGISKAVEQPGTTDPGLTETHAVFGSPTYMSPEQIRSSKNVDPRSDIWSLGVGLFEMLSSKLPFVADNVPGLLVSIVADAPFRLSGLAAGVPLELEAVVLACLEKDPSRRIPSAVELAKHLAPFASAEGAQLVARIERGAGSSPSVSNSGSLPPGPAAFRSSTYPSLPRAPLASPSRASVAPSGAFGSTGDLSATAPAQRRSQRGALLGVGVTAAVLLVGVGFGIYFGRLRPAPVAVPTSVAATQPPPGADPLPPPQTTPSAAPAPEPVIAAAPSAASAARRAARPPAGRAGAPARSASPAAPPPVTTSKTHATDDRL